MRWLALSLLLTSASAEVVTTRTIGRGERLALVDLLGPDDEIADFLGQVARRPLQRGRPVRLYDVEAASAVVRQQTVLVKFIRGPLTLRTEGRALTSGRVGDHINIALHARRRPLSARITEPGVVEVY